MRKLKRVWSFFIRKREDTRGMAQGSMRASALPCRGQLIPRDKIPPEGYLRVLATLREWLGILGVKDIDAAEKKIRKAGPFNQWKETAWDLWRRGEI